MRPIGPTVGYLPGCDAQDVRLAMRPFRPALFVLFVLAVAACGDGPIEAPPGPLPLVTPPVAPAAVGPLATEGGSVAGGVGGSFTMTAGGEKITSIPLGPTGIVIPEGFPVRVRISGAITRTATAGLKEFCSLERWADACAGQWAEIVAETPIPPSGAAFVGGAGAAQVAWAGADPVSPAEGSRLALDGPAGGELWAGRSEWGGRSGAATTSTARSSRGLLRLRRQVHDHRRGRRRGDADRYG
jgi:hypothetical protein